MLENGGQRRVLPNATCLKPEEGVTRAGRPDLA